jgi:hypothetical protein
VSNNELHVRMRKRAYELADTGRYGGWPEIEGALSGEEDFHPIMIRNFGNDALFVSMVNPRCRRARERNG